MEERYQGADCTIACENGHVTAHKIILCNHSKYIQDILSKFPTADHPIIILTDLNIADVRILVYYMYTGELVFTNDSSPISLSRAAQILKIDSLTDLDEEEEIISDNDNQSKLDLKQHIQHQHQHLNLSNSQDRGQDHGVDVDDDDDDEIDADEEMITSHNNLQQLQDSKQFDNITNKIRCHLCNIGLSDVKCLYRHVLTRHLPEKWGYKCEFCDREFSRDDHLMRHYTTKHKNMEFNREKIRETRRLNREMAKNFHDQISTV